MLLRDRSARRRAVVYVALVGLCLVMLAVSRSGPVQELRSGINFAVAPIQDTLADGTRSVTQVLGAFAEIEQLRRERLDLQATVDRLEDEVAALEAVRDENERLTRQLRTKNRLDHETVAGQVTRRNFSQFERVVFLDIGSESGVVLDAPVLSDGGALVGSVSEVGEGWSAVQLISDTRSVVIGLDTRTRATGEIGGRLSSPLAMRDIRVTDNIGIRDRVVTAGIQIGRRFRSFFPRGLAIGRVVDVRQEPGAIVQTALIEPDAELERIEAVLVITDFQPPRRQVDEADEDT